MPLFVCSQCHAVENTALGDYWSRVGRGEDPLCSSCMSDEKKKWSGIEGEDWHGQFPKVIATPEIIDARRNEFIWIPPDFT